MLRLQRVPSLASALLFVGLVIASELHARDATFDWPNLTSSSSLSWVPCFSSFQCARLTVPLQYSNPGAGEAQIALLMSPSSFPKNDSRYLGSILFNPGGPGDSGVNTVMTLASTIRPVIGPQYDFIGFDPRGELCQLPHGRTSYKCYSCSPPEALEFYAPYPQNVNESVSSFGRAYAQSQILGKLAMDRAQLVAESVSTPAVALDMFSIMKALGQDKLNYYGISYGTVLGATFAAMFPNNVGRFVLDGVVDPDGWYQGNMTNLLLDTDKVLTTIYHACVSAGPSLCAIYENTTDLVHARVSRLLDDVHLAPVLVYNDTDPSNITFSVVDYTVVESHILATLKNPYSMATALAEAIVQLENGDGSLILGAAGVTNVAQFATCDFDPSQPYVAGFLDIRAPIECGDSLVDTRRTLQAAQDDYQGMLQLSQFATTIYPLMQGICTHV
ncbi:uncharacterized protein PHACADRAFT_32147 [Phanerochaete carnosa HHB-10118-sp]|uniref:AB hydrolase-1 domain-containing protein n=1 Tax=Phanerochaete carnosa (strain HHB-10118-sp) TaxID=650164 RepID=K5UN05_PHACS|nr:uncharacterized protein PHACADRAFT_32147 [Phanerochaete carnosa HHB-10118-sp]EKM51106.1 hypothetical protein PHACADRAFT_32147 [Phanerochaete carnosa HHB-10118-sp]